MGRLFTITLEGRFYSCKYCNTHLALSGDIISKFFNSRNGRAYLFDRVVNVTEGVPEERVMLTGMHTVVDIFCVSCGAIIGWKYNTTPDKNQKYKEGKFILERYKVLGPDGDLYYFEQDIQDDESETDEDEG